MVTLTRNSDYQPLTWKGATKRNGERSATVTCNNGHGMSLTNHAIADDGTVKPSVVCPYEGCTWHEFVKLEGWNHAG